MEKRKILWAAIALLFPFFFLRADPAGMPDLMEITRANHGKEAGGSLAGRQFGVLAWGDCVGRPEETSGIQSGASENNTTGEHSGTEDRPVLDRVKQWFGNFEEYVERTDLITPGELQKLPVGLRTTIGNTDYDLLITQAVFGPDNTEVAVYLRISGPDWQGEDRSFYFGADKILISKQGGFIGDAKLALMGDIALKGKGDVFSLRFVGKKEEGDHTNTSDGLPPSYAIVNCEGFKELQLSAVLELDSEKIGVVENGKMTDQPLRTTFFCAAEALDDIVVKVDLPEFGLRHVPDWTFMAEDVMLDFSQTRNAPDFKGYSTSGSNSGAVDFGNIWQGLYIKRIRLQFPDYIKKVSGAKPSVLAEKMWLDEKGFTGKIAAEDVLMLTEGSLGGWGFSIEKFSMEFLHDQIKSGLMKGQIELPVSKAGKYEYEGGFATDGSWKLKLGLGEKIDFDFIKGREVDLLASSFLEAKKEKDKDLQIRANLSGSMKLNPLAAENDKFGFANISFKGMEVSNQAPFFEIKELRWTDDLSIKGFPVTIKDLNLSSVDGKIGFGFKTLVHFGDAGDGNFGGELALKLRSEIKNEGERQKWDFAGVDVGKVAVDFAKSGLKFKGDVELVENNSLYGDGFQGSVDFEIEPLSLGVRADLMLGARQGFRYWYVDVLANLGTTGIPIGPGFKISAIGGGAYKRMKMVERKSGSSDLGQTTSGLFYEPDSTKSLGLKASLVFAAQNEKLFNAELGMEMAFNAQGGLSSMVLSGAGQLMSEELNAMQRFNQRVLQLASAIQPSVEEQQRAIASEASISAQVKLLLDIENSRFTGTFDTYMNLGIIKGAGSKGHLGQMGMSFGGDEWYIKVGEPKHPLGVKMKVGPLQASLDAYFMTGNRLPAFPELPSRVASLMDVSYPRPSASELAKGNGLAFGASFSMSTGTIPLLIFYAAFDADVGFDVMLKQHLNSLCQETGDKPGINGWYAQGQAYAYMMADVGLYLKLFGKKRNFSVLKGEVGTLLQAGLPNPSSFEGNLALNISLLNGLVKGRFNVGFDLGTPCTIVNQGFADGVEIIADLQPGENASGVDVFSIPQVAFNLPLETEIREEYNNEEKQLKISLDQYEFWHGGTRLGGDLRWNEDKRKLEFVSHDIFPPKTSIKLKLAIGAKEKSGSSWKALLDNNGAAYQEKREFSFTTGEGPDSIPWSNVALCYPVKGQSYFLPREHDRAFVYLKRGMADLLTDADYRKRVFVISGKDTMETSFTYNQAEKRLLWTPPPGLLPRTTYELLFVLQHKGDASYVSSGGRSGDPDTPDLTDGSSVLYEGEEGALEQGTVQLGGSLLKTDKDKVVLRYSFTTSRYGTFGEKMADVRLTRTYRTPVMTVDAHGAPNVSEPDVHYLQAKMQAGESFEEIERKGHVYTGGKPLVQVRAGLGTEPYYLRHIYPLVYQEYPYDGFVSFERAAGQGLEPDWAVYASELYSMSSNQYFPWIYYLPFQYKRDFESVLYGVANMGIWGRPYYLDWLKKSFVPIRKGDYPVWLQYVLPDGTVTSRRRMVFENRVE